jgi:hypothetical protein
VSEIKTKEDFQHEMKNIAQAAQFLVLLERREKVSNAIHNLWERTANLLDIAHKHLPDKDL